MSFTTFFGESFDRVLDTLPKLFGPLSPQVIEAFEQRVEWVELPGGATLFRQGDDGDSLYIVAGGRLQVVVEEDDGTQRIIGEVARGETVGEMALLTGEPRTATVCAVRDTLLMQLDRTVFDELVHEYPDILLGISRKTIQRLTQAVPGRDAQPEVTNVTLMPVTAQAPVAEVARRLAGSLGAHGSVIRLTAEVVDEMTGVPGRAQSAEHGPENLRLASWLDHQSLLHRFVIYEAKYDPSPWTTRSLRQADRILLVAAADDPPQPSALEEALLPTESSAVGVAPRELVVVHRDSTRTPTGTSDWYNGRRLTRHHHARLDEPADWASLARFLAGTAVGIVFAGGGARGFAHIGVIRALREAGIPVDLAGGTSMGAVIAAGVASDWKQETLFQKNRHAFMNEHPLNDYNLLPTISLLKGRKIDRLLRNDLGDINIEDLWLPFFCVSSNLTQANMTVHRSGSLWKAVRASLTIPGILPPVVYGDDLHVDGATFNNLPVDVMRAFGAGRIIAADIDARKSLHLDYSELPSSWDVFMSRVLPTRKRIEAPGMVNTVFKASFLGGTHQRDAARKADLYFNPDVAQVRLLDFSCFDEVVEIGYRHAMQKLEEADLDRIGATSDGRPTPP